jgi:2'-5' RNA ligase
MKKAQKETIRTFIAVELPQEIHDKLKQLQDDLKASMPDVRWTKYGNVHLTLKFLGDVQISRIDAISETLRGIARQFSPFTISLTGIGAFPNSRRPRVVWVGLEKGGDKLIKIAESIEASMRKLGFPREKRKFSPHLTVGRVRRLTNPSAMTQALERSVVGKIGEFVVQRVSLIRSQLDPAGSIYTILTEAPFSGLDAG